MKYTLEMRSTTRLELTEAQRRELEKGYRLGEKHCFRMRCLAVLLKADGMSAEKVGKRVDMEQHTVNKWLCRYKTEGIKGLETRPGRYYINHQIFFKLFFITFRNKMLYP